MSLKSPPLKSKTKIGNRNTISNELSRCRRNLQTFGQLARPNPAMGCLFIEDSEITIYGVRARLAWLQLVAVGCAKLHQVAASCTSNSRKEPIPTPQDTSR